MREYGSVVDERFCLADGKMKTRKIDSLIWWCGVARVLGFSFAEMDSLASDVYGGKQGNWQGSFD